MSRLKTKGLNIQCAKGLTNSQPHLQVAVLCATECSPVVQDCDLCWQKSGPEHALQSLKTVHEGMIFYSYVFTL